MRRSGVVGLVGGPEPAARLLTVLGSLQHRGQSAAIAMLETEQPDGEIAHVEQRVRGLVSELSAETLGGGVEGSGAVAALGMVSASRRLGRETSLDPFTASSTAGRIAVAVSGDLTNLPELQAVVEASGQAFVSGRPAEVIATHVAMRLQQGASPLDALHATLAEARGAWAVILLHDGHLFAARDPAGVRPLCLGRGPDGCWVVASESCGFALAEIEFEADVAPGACIQLSAGAEPVERLLESSQTAHCSREWVYFARPDSWMDGTRIIQARRVMGLRLAREAPAEADIVVPVPDSGRSAASGYADGVGLPLVEAMHRNRYVQEVRNIRDSRTREHLRRAAINVVGPLVKDRRVVVVDDSMVGGSTMRRLIAMLRESGAAAIHVRIAAPPLNRSCDLGVDLPHSTRLAIHRTDELLGWLDCDSLAFLSPAGLAAAVGLDDRLCFACTGQPAPAVTGVTAAMALPGHVLPLINDITEEAA